MPSMTRRDALASAGAALALVAGCLGPDRSLPNRPTGTWRQRRYDAANGAAADVAVPPRGTPAWDEGDAHVADPLVADGTVYSASDEVTALDAKNGEERWSADLGDRVEQTPALVDGRLLVPAGSEVLAFDTDGNEEWSASLPRPAAGAVTATADPAVAVVPVGNRSLRAFDPASGDVLWDDSLTGASPAAVGDGRVYAVGYRSGDQGALRALSATGGDREWSVPLSDPEAAPVVTDDGLLVVDGETLALHDPPTGERRRELGAFGPVDAPPAVADGTAYVGSTDGLAAVSLADGTVEWSADVTVTSDTGPTVGRDAVVAPVTDVPGVVAFERSGGGRRWEYAIDGFDAATSTSATLAENAAFVVTNDSSGVVALGDLPPETE